MKAKIWESFILTQNVVYKQITFLTKLKPQNTVYNTIYLQYNIQFIRCEGCLSN